jgi:hypothetical protein
MENEAVFLTKSLTSVTTNDLRGAFGKLHSYVEGKVIFDMKIEGMGAMQINVKLPISQEDLAALTYQQVQSRLLSWLDRAIREESLREWFESPSDHSDLENE